MCMLFGFTGNQNYELSGALWEFYSHSPYHPDGWGLVLCNPKREKASLIKEAVPAYKSTFLKGLINGSIPSRLAIGHIRYATAGKNTLNNTHPFIQVIKGREWIFAHNGSVKTPFFAKLVRKAKGETDSERISCYIAEQLENLPDNVTVDKQIKCVEAAVYTLAAYGKLNLIFTDGTHLFVHTNYKDTLYMYKMNGLACFSTKPLSKTVNRFKWTKVPMNRLFVFKNGELVYEGKKHEHEYFKPTVQKWGSVINA